MISFEYAVTIAAKYHSGQKDLDGNPALLHPLAVALKGGNDKERIVGVLHDVVEDSACTLSELESIGVDKDIVGTLKTLTHNKPDSYDDYLLNIIHSGDIVAMRVKRNDLLHNIARNDESTERKKKIKAKHTKALLLIEKALQLIEKTLETLSD